MPINIDIVALQDEAQERGWIPAKRQAVDLLLATIDVVRVEVGEAVACGQLPGAPAALIVQGIERMRRHWPGPCGGAGVVLPAFAGDHPAGLNIATVEMQVVAMVPVDVDADVFALQQ